MENNNFVIEMVDGLIFIKFKRSIRIDYDLAYQLIETRKQLSSSSQCLMLFDGNGVNNVTKEARDFLASKEATDGLIAGAFVINSPLATVLCNFFLKISKPQRPSKLFTSHTDAIKWLRAFKNESEEVIIN